MHGLVGQCARARDDANAAFAVNRGGHDADLALAGRNYTRAVGADQPHVRILIEAGAYLDHVKRGNALGNANDDFDTGFASLRYRFGGKTGGHEDHACVGPRFINGINDGIEHRAVKMTLTAATRRYAADQLRAVGNGLLGMEGALLAGKALTNDPGIFIDQNSHVRVFVR